MLSFLDRSFACILTSSELRGSIGCCSDVICHKIKVSEYLLGFSTGRSSWYEEWSGDPADRSSKDKSLDGVKEVLPHEGFAT